MTDPRNPFADPTPDEPSDAPDALDDNVGFPSSASMAARPVTQPEPEAPAAPSQPFPSWPADQAEAPRWAQGRSASEASSSRPDLPDGPFGRRDEAPESIFAAPRNTPPVAQTPAPDTAPPPRDEQPTPPATPSDFAPEPAMPGYASDAPGFARPAPRPSRSSAITLYALILFAVPTLGVSAAVALFAVMTRRPPDDRLGASHFRFQKRTLLGGAFAAVVGGLLIVIGLGVFVLFLAALWMLLRGAYGVLRLKAEKPIDNPATLLI